MGSMIIMSRFLHLLFIKPIHLPIQKKKKKENMINEWFVDSQKKKKVTHAFGFNQAINERTRETST